MAYYEIYLYNENATRSRIASSDNNPGILNPIIEKEVNTSGTLSFTVLPTHPKCDEFYRFKSRLDVIINGQVIFRGRITSITEDFYKQKSIECEGALGYLNDSIFHKTGAYDTMDRIDMKIYGDVYSLLKMVVRTSDNPLEDWKYVNLGVYENPGNENLCDNSKLVQGFFDRNDIYTERYNDNVAASTDLISVNNDYIYYVSIACGQNYAHMSSLSTWRINFYDENEEFIPFLRDTWGVDRVSEPDWTLPDNETVPYAFGRFKTKDFWDPDNDVRKLQKAPTYFRISITSLINMEATNRTRSVLWIQGVDSEVDSFTYNDSVELTSFDTNGNILSSCCIDGRTNFVRTRIYNGTIYLDYLNGRRTINDDMKPAVYNAPNTHEFEYSVNILDMSFDGDEIEPYSCVVPVSNNRLYMDDISHGFPYVYAEDQDAVNLFGRIYKLLDVGSADGAQISKKTALKRAEKYLKLYDPMIPDSITIKALDKGVFFDTEKFQMIDIGDAVHVVSEPHGIDKSLICLSLKFDIMNPQNNEYKIGRYIPEGDDYKIKNLTDSFAKSKKK